MVAPRNFNLSNLPGCRTNLIDYVNNLSDQEYQQYEIWRIENRDNFIQEYNNALDDDLTVGSTESLLDELIGEVESDDSETDSNDGSNSDDDSDSENEDEDDYDEVDSEIETIIDNGFNESRSLRNELHEESEEEYGPEDDYTSCGTVYEYESDSDYSSDDEYDIGETRTIFSNRCNLLI